MKKTLCALTVATILAAPLAVQAADDTSVNGFIDIIGNTDAGAVFAAEGELDASKKMGAVTVRVDADVNLAINGGSSATGGDSGRLEQAYFAWGATEAVTVLGGLFNNPIGQELEDAPDMDFTSHSVNYNILDGQTVLYGNNVAGIAAAGAVGPATVTIALIDDLGLATNSKGEGKLSTAAVVNFSPMKNLDLELGYVTQDGQAENVVDFNGKYSAGALTVGLDYLAADAAVDSATNLWLGFDVNDKVNVKARYESVAFEAAGVDDSTRTTVYLSYVINDNLSAALENSSGDNASAEAVSGIVDDSVTTVEFIGTF
jgi:hypothetical protein